MSRSALTLAAALAVMGSSLLLGGEPVLAASGWWVRAPFGSRPFSEIASDQGQATLAISGGRAGWYRPSTGRFRPLPALGPPATAVAAAGRVGVVALRGGALAVVDQDGQTRSQPSIPGVVRAIALGSHGQLAIASSRGLFAGRLGEKLKRVAAGPATAVEAPPRDGLSWLALIGGRLWTGLRDRGWAGSEHAPRFPAGTGALTELGSGAILVAEAGGLIWLGQRRSWERAFQVLPAGGLDGVPRVTALAADGWTAAYVGTDGFGTLLTPDGGYSWYRAPPPGAAVRELATVGPVFSRRPRGMVVAVTDAGIYLHRLQVLPAPPVYSPPRASAELEGTVGVTALAVLLVTFLLWLHDRRRRASV
ncbi:MAG TPA: hypothetical protein VI138_02535 [Candidatus Dormibacteraeota bacterium]